MKMACMKWARSLLRPFAALSTICLCLVVSLTAIGIWNGLDTAFPALYRNTASLGVAICELKYGTTGYVGLTDVANVLAQHGFELNPDEKHIAFLSAHTEIAYDALLTATGLQHVDQSKTFGLNINEPGTIDHLAFWYSALLQKFMSCR